MEKVKFKQFQALRDKAFLAFSQDTPLDTAAGSLEMMDSIVLAFVGDAWYAVTMGGGADELFGGRARGVDALLSKITIVLSIAFAIVALVLGRLMNTY